MTVIINGDTGIDKITDGSVVAADIGAGEITQAKLASGVANTGPAFSALLGTNQSISSSTFTKVQYNTEDWDTNSNYDNTTNYRFTPSVAGYYQVNASVRFNYTGAAGDNTQIHIYRNGVHWDCQARINSSGNYGNISISSLLYCNGSSDYIEIYGYSTHGSSLFDVSSNNPSRFSAHLVRAA